MLQQYINECKQLIHQDPTLRAVIFHDLLRSVTRAVLFRHRYDSLFSPGAVAGLFNSTIDTLPTTIEVVDVMTYPILTYIGLMRITLAYRVSTGDVLIADGEMLTVDNYISFK